MTEGIKIRQATKEGYAYWKVGGLANLSYPTAKTRRGRVQNDGDISPTIMADNIEIYKLEKENDMYRIRKLTPRETWRLMDYSDEDFDKAEKVESKTQLYKQAGNGIVKNVAAAIFGQMIPGKEDQYRGI